MEKKYIWISVLVAIIYMALMCALGLFGAAAQTVVLAVVPYFFALLGLAIAIVLPYRIAWAIDRNRKIREKIVQERKVAQMHTANKKLREQAIKYDQMGMQ